jgi:hypothetical protein
LIERGLPLFFVDFFYESSVDLFLMYRGKHKVTPFWQKIKRRMEKDEPMNQSTFLSYLVRIAQKTYTFTSLFEEEAEPVDEYHFKIKGSSEPVGYRRLFNLLFASIYKK